MKENKNWKKKLAKSDIFILDTIYVVDPFQVYWQYQRKCFPF